MRTREAVKSLVDAIREIDRALCQLPTCDRDYDRVAKLRNELFEVAVEIDGRLPLVEKLPKPVT